MQNLQVYDENLIFLNIIGQASPNLPFYMPPQITKVQICEKFFVYLDAKEIILLDRSNGWAMKRIKIESNDFLLNSDTNRILTYDNGLKKVVSYDFEGKSQVFDINLAVTNESIKLVDCLKEKLLFLDSKSLCFFISRN